MTVGSVVGWQAPGNPDAIELATDVPIQRNPIGYFSPSGTGSRGVRMAATARKVTAPSTSVPPP